MKRSKADRALEWGVAAGIFAIMALVGLWATKASSDRLTEADIALAYVCSELRLDCRGLEKPQIVAVDLNRWLGAENGITYNGAYFPSIPRVIFLNNGKLTEPRLQVIVHEMVHYVDWQYGITIGMDDRCITEGLAFHIANKWAREHGGRPVEDWHRMYGCPELTIEMGEHK